MIKSNSMFFITYTLIVFCLGATFGKFYAFHMKCNNKTITERIEILESKIK